MANTGSDSETTRSRLAARLAGYRQEHVLQWWGDLSPDGQQMLAEQIESLDLATLSRLCLSTDGQTLPDETPAARAARAVPPALIVRTPRTPADAADWSAARTKGLRVLGEGKVAVILVAGGQGTRLDFPHPKGMFPIAPVTGKSLFQLLVEQVVARSRQAGTTIPYYVMTSDATHDETVAFFDQHDRFGLPADAVRLFRQGNMPAVDARTGRLLMADRHLLCTSPDGHGGIISAMARRGILDDMQQRGIEYLFYHQVDNPLISVCDPVFLGLHVQHAADVSLKVVAKQGPEEKVGVVADIDGRTEIIEYSDLPQEAARRCDAAGELQLWAGSTAIHIFNRSFLDRLQQEQIDLPFHRARKNVPCLDDGGRLVKPQSENAFKFERFIFDVLPHSRRTLVVECRREDEFNPLKNKTGEFSPDDVRQSLSRLHAGWLRTCGVDVPNGLPVEISPLYALDAEELATRLPVALDLQAPVYLKPASG